MCAGYRVSCQYIFVKENWHDLTKNWGGERKESVWRSVFHAWMSAVGTADKMEMFEEEGGMLCLRPWDVNEHGNIWFSDGKAHAFMRLD